MLIRKAQTDDLPKIITIIDNHYKLFGDFVNLDKYDSDLKDIRYYFNSGGCFWVITLNKNLLGFIAVIPLKKQELELKRFYVEPFWHGKKIADLLFKQAEIFAIENDFKKLVLWTDSRYDRAKGFYIKNSFKLVKQEIKNDADNEYCAVLYEKTISY